MEKCTVGHCLFNLYTQDGKLFATKNLIFCRDTSSKGHCLYCETEAVDITELAKHVREKHIHLLIRDLVEKDPDLFLLTRTPHP